MATDDKTLADVLALPAGPALDRMLASLLAGGDKPQTSTERNAAIGKHFSHIYDCTIATDMPDVARHKSGRRYRFVYPNHFQMWECLYQSCEDDAFRADMDGALNEWVRPARPFSTDYAAMGELIDKMAELGKRPYLLPRWDGDDFVAHRFLFIPGRYVAGIAETLPLAVTRAAIAALWKGQE